MIESPSTLEHQILNLAEGIGKEMKTLKGQILSNIDCGYINGEDSVDVDDISAIYTQLKDLIGDATAILEFSDEIADIDARLSAIENIDYMGLYED